MVGEPQRTHLYGEHNDGPAAIRMVRKGAYKLIYYPDGNRRQLFNLDDDRQEMHDLYGTPELTEVTEELEALMARELYGGDEARAENGQLIGIPEPTYEPQPDRGLSGQRDWR